jgi:hypothetical protein
VTSSATNDVPTVSTRAQECFDRPAAVTRSLLGYGPLAGAVYLASGLIQALTRDGFDLARHDLSLLANGSLGWIQITTLVVAGLMTIAAAVGARRALDGGPAGTWGPALLAGYGLALVVAGIFVADPMAGFPVGTPDGPPTEPSLSGMLHMTAGGIGFACLVAATLVVARRFASERRTGWAWGSRAVGLVVLGGFLGVATGSTSSWAVLGLWVGVVAGWAWIGAVAVLLYRRTPHPRG